MEFFLVSLVIGVPLGFYFFFKGHSHTTEHHENMITPQFHRFSLFDSGEYLGAGVVLTMVVLLVILGVSKLLGITAPFEFMDWVEATFC